MAEKHKIEFLYDASVIEAFCREGFSEEYGARHMRRTIERLIETPLTKLLMERKSGVGKRIRCASTTEGLALKWA